MIPQRRKRTLQNERKSLELLRSFCTTAFHFHRAASLRRRQPIVLLLALPKLVQHTQLGREDNKKFFYRSVSVKEGEMFSIQKKMDIDQSFMFTGGQKTDAAPDSRYRAGNSEYLGCFEESPVDSCEIRYSSFIPLQIMGILHVRNIDHLKCIPTIYLNEEQYLVQVLMTILENTEKHALEVDRLLKEFRKWVRRDLAAFYELYNAFGDINTQLFQKYPEYFEVTLDMRAMIKLKPSEFRDGKYPITFPKEYFEREMKPAVFSASTAVATQSVAGVEDTDPITIEDDGDMNMHN